MKLFCKIYIDTYAGDKPFACKHCEKLFADKAVLRKHERIHSGEKPFTCEHCQKSFSQR